METASELSQRLNLTFTNISILKRALTHRSYLNENPNEFEDNERLEFLGDAILDFIVGAWAYNRFPELREGDLTKIRSAFVRNDQLATFARKIDLGNALMLGKGELNSGGLNKDGLLGSAFEALLGAIYIDSGLRAVEKFVNPILNEVEDSIIDSIHNPKSRLQEWAQSEKKGTPQYIILSSEGPDHAKVYEVEVLVQGVAYGKGRGASKTLATRAAAEDALKKLNGSS